MIFMEIGALNKRITFQKLYITTNENGFDVKAWEDIKTVWAHVSNLHGREYFAAQAVQAEQTVKFTVRYFKNVDTTMRILFKDKSYNITAIDNIKFDNRFLEIKAMEVDISG